MSEEVSVKVDGKTVLEEQKREFEKDTAMVAEDVINSETHVRLDSSSDEIDFDNVNLDDLTPEEIIAAREQYTEIYFPLPEDFPTKEELEVWEKKYGKIRTRRMAYKEAYIVRPMNRGEFRQFIKMVQQHSQDPVEVNMYQEELMVEMCLVWPPATVRDIRGESDPSARIAAAGTASILSADIQEISNMAPEAVGPPEEL